MDFRGWMEIPYCRDKEIEYDAVSKSWGFNQQVFLKKL